MIVTICKHSALRHASFACGLFIIYLGSNGATAQPAADAAARNPLADAQCLVRAVGDEGKKTPMAIIVPATQATAMIKRGFTPVPCQPAFASPKAIADWRNNICIMASNPNEKMQDQFERYLGERPNVLCGMAEQVVGPWRTGGPPANVKSAVPGNGGL